MVNVWGAQAVVANTLPDLDKQDFEDLILGLWAKSVDDDEDASWVATACVIVAMQYANKLGISIDSNLKKVAGHMN